jgi:hypothetical protein
MQIMYTFLIGKGYKLDDENIPTTLPSIFHKGSTRLSSTYRTALSGFAFSLIFIHTQYRTLLSSFLSHLIHSRHYLKWSDSTFPSLLLLLMYLVISIARESNTRPGRRSTPQVGFYENHSFASHSER